MERCDILVRGDGAVGATAALALSRQGLEIALLGAERGPAPSGDVRCYALNAASVALLRSIKVWDALPREARTAVHDMHIEGDRPGARLDFSAWAEALPQLAWIVDAAALERTLHDALRFAPRVHRVTAEMPAALTVLAEGKASASRVQRGAQMARHGYGQRAIAARLLGQWPHGGLARQWFRAPDVLALLPIDQPEAGRGLALVWSLPDERAEALLALEPEAFEAELAAATAGAAGGLKLASARVAWPLAIGRAEPLFGPGWVLLGDAAHVVHPLAGQGLNLGLGDVAELVQVLDTRPYWRSVGDPKLLRAYERARKADFALVGGSGDGIQRIFTHPHPAAQALRNAGMQGFNSLTPIKKWVARRAMGLPTLP